MTSFREKQPSILPYKIISNEPTKIPYQRLKVFSNIIRLLWRRNSVKDLYHRFPDLANFKSRLAEEKQTKRTSRSSKGSEAATVVWYDQLEE
jgi:hypothetical protein